MIQCVDCEFYQPGASGTARFLCDPFKNIKEPECLAKWNLIKLEILVRSHQATLAMYRRLAPLQEKMFRHLEREIEDVEDADSWKYADDEEEDENDKDFRL
jgi:hypothetical protein